MRWILAFAFVAVCLCACSQSSERPALPVAQIAVASDNGRHAFKVEMATDDASRAHGLMERTELAPDAGMLFVFPRPQLVAFWMKNTPLPLDMLFIRADGTIAAIVAETTPYSEKPVPSLEPVRAVLELNGNRTRELGIKPGDTVHGAIFP
jgi:uncharacterized protein